VFILIAFLPNLAQLIQSTDLPAHLSRPRIFLRAPSISSFFAFLAFLIGLCAVFIIIPCQTILQENTPEANRGKLFAVLAVLMTSFSAVPVIAVGGLSDLFGVTPIFLFLGIGILALGLLARDPGWFLSKHSLPLRVREFLGLGHWEKQQ
jgi:MFS family permease